MTSEEVRTLLGHARTNTSQIYTRIRPPQLERAVAFYEAHAVRMLTPGAATKTPVCRARAPGV